MYGAAAQNLTTLRISCMPPASHKRPAWKLCICSKSRQCGMRFDPSRICPVKVCHVPVQLSGRSSLSRVQRHCNPIIPSMSIGFICFIRVFIGICLRLQDPTGPCLQGSGTTATTRAADIRHRTLLAGLRDDGHNARCRYKTQDPARRASREVNGTSQNHENVSFKSDIFRLKSLCCCAPVRWNN